MKWDRRRAILWAALIAWTAVMFILSAQTAKSSGNISLSIVDRLQRWLPFLRGVKKDRLDTILRKAAHFAEFAVEGALIGSVALRIEDRKRAIIVSLAACGVLAVSNELVQMFSEGRSCELRDMLIDFSGALLGLIVCDVIRRLCNKKRNIPG